MAGPWYIVVNGSEIDIDATYGTYTTGMFGFGMPPVGHNATEQAQLPGGLFQNMKVRPRVLQLKIIAKGTTLATYHAVRKFLINAVRPNVGGELAPVEIRYDGSGTKYFCTGYYDGGLDGSRDAGNRTPETLMLRFICYDPFWYALSATTAALATKADVADAASVVRCIDGIWYNISSSFGANPVVFAKTTDGSIYIGGSFTNVGSSTGDYIVKWNPTTELLSSLSTGLGAQVIALAPAPDGGLYVGGAFQNAGDGDGDYVVKWTGSAWESLGTGAAAVVLALAVGHDGKLFAGGTFANFVDGSGDGITQWNGAAWSSLGTGLSGGSATAYCLAIGLDGRLYAGGNFTAAGGVAAGGIAVWNGASWAAVGTGTGVAGSGATVYTVAVGPDGSVYIGGDFTSVDGVSANNIARWNGSSWTAMGDGTNALVNRIYFGSDDRMYVTGAFTSAGYLSSGDRVATWNGSTWSPVSIDLPGAATVTDVLLDGEDLYLGFSTFGTATAWTANTTVTNSGTAPAYPVVTIKRASGTTARVELLRNQTTGQVLYLDYSLLDGETLTIDLSPGAKSIVSDYFGNVIGRALLPNSDFSSWCLQPGANTILTYVYQAGGPTVTAGMTFTPASWSAD